jgi:hypothetical protein
MSAGVFSASGSGEVGVAARDRAVAVGLEVGFVVVVADAAARLAFGCEDREVRWCGGGDDGASERSSSGGGRLDPRRRRAAGLRNVLSFPVGVCWAGDGAGSRVAASRSFDTSSTSVATKPLPGCCS